MKKHMVYAEDLLQELMNHPDNAIYKWTILELVNKVVREKEVTIGMHLPLVGCSEEAN